MTTNALGRLIPDLSATCLRFPACVAASVAACVINNVDAANGISFTHDELWRINYALIAAFLAGGAGHLLAQSREWTHLRSALFGFTAGSAAALVSYFPSVSGAFPLFLLGGLTLVLMISGHLRDGVSQNAIWLFNARLALAALLSVVIGLVFGLGLSAIVSSIEYLFAVKIGNSAYEHIWSTAISLIGPVYGLSLVPAQLDEEFRLSDDDDLLERGVSVMINYVLVPLAVIYIGILHIYALKIAWTWELPKGQIGNMVMLFGFGAAATYLIAMPWTDRGTLLLRWFVRTWFWFIVVPAILLAIAVGKRISDYGVTPERYGLIVIFVWLLTIAVYLALRRSLADSRVVLAVLALCLLIASTGPWGARSISVSSQVARLMTILGEHRYLEDGRLVADIPSAGTLPKATANGLQTIVALLEEFDALERLEPLFAGRPDNPFAASRDIFDQAKAIRAQLHIDRRSINGRTQQPVNYLSKTPHLVSAADGAWLSGPHRIFINRTYRNPTQDTSPSSDDVVVTVADGEIVIEQGGRRWSVSASQIMTQAIAHTASADKAGDPLRLEIASDNRPATLLIESLQGGRNEDETSLYEVNFWLLLPAR